jgi:SAM-dependent methyltransferase
MTDERHSEPGEAGGWSGEAVLPGPPLVEAPEDIAIEEAEPESHDPTTQPDPAPALGPAEPPARKRADSGSRLRGRMTLRIPDDEVTRPTSQRADEPAPAATSPAHDAPAQVPIVASRIITINPPPPPPPVDVLAETSELDAAPDSEPATVLRPPPDEDSWTPFQPTVEPQPTNEDDADARDATVNDLGRNSSAPPKADSAARAQVDEPSAAAPSAADSDANAATIAETSSRQAESEPPRSPQASGPDIVIDEDIPAEMTAEAISKPPESVEAVEVEELGVKSEPPRSEATDLGEVAPEDVVSIAVAPLVARAATAPTTTPAKRPSGPTAGPATPGAKAPPPAPPAARPPLLLVPGSVSPLAPPPMSEAAAQRRRARPWWEDLFNDDFIRTMAKITDAQIATEVNFIEESLGLAKGAVVLDLACGTGRHAIEMTSRGYQVVGFDLSLAMLARAADEAQERNQKLNFVQGDMREMTFEETFDGVYAWNTSFGFFEEEKNHAVIANVHRALKGGGLLLLDVANRDFLAHQSPSLAWFEGDGCVCMDEMHIDWITSRMRVKRTMMLDDGRTRETDYSIRVYALHELGRILHETGFRVAEVSGRVATPGVFFGADSPRILVVAEKR